MDLLMTMAVRLWKTNTLVRAATKFGTLTMVI